MTESTAVATRGFNTSNYKKYTSIGLLAPNMEAKIIDIENGDCLPPCSHGELLLRGPTIMKGFYLALANGQGLVQLDHVCFIYKPVNQVQTFSWFLF
jgi:acyl-CoA synthetase (AMP-forming)/AMP-acid ligase II